MLPTRMLETPTLIDSPEQLVAYVHQDIAREQIRHVMGPSIQEVMGVVAAQGVGAAGAWLCHHANLDPARFNFRICVPVQKPVTPTGNVQAGVLAKTRALRTVYTGPYEGLGDAWGEFTNLAKSLAHSVGPSFWEVYLAGPESGSDSSKFRTQLNWTIAS